MVMLHHKPEKNRNGETQIIYETENFSEFAQCQ